MARRWRAWHPGGGAPGADVRLGPEEAHHVVRVLRLRVGEPIGVFDGAGREWEGTLVEAREGVAVVRLGDERTDEVEPALEIALVQGLCRPERMEWVLEKATEVGVRSVVLAACDRSEGPSPSPARLDRWRRILLESTKQSGRRRIPELTGPVPLPAALEGWEGKGPGIVLLPEAPPLAAALAGPAPAAAALAVGPEGGFTAAEAAAMQSAGWAAASLGPRILRTETAGPVALALVLHRWDSHL